RASFPCVTTASRCGMMILEVTTVDIGHKIYELRKQHGLTQEQFAEMFHVTRQTVSNWENNKNYPDMETLRQISEAYSVSFDELLKSDKALIQQIDKTKKRAGVTRWLIVLIAALLVLLAIVFVVPRIAASVFYNPGEVVATHQDDEVSMDSCRMDTDISVFSELLLPCMKFNSVDSHNTGLGKYNVMIQQTSWISSSEQKLVSGSIDKNALTLFNPGDLKRPPGNAFAWTINRHDISKSMTQNQQEMLEDHLKENPGETEENVDFNVSLGGAPKSAKRSLQELDENELQVGYIDFDRVMNWDEAMTFIQKYELMSPWIGIVTSGDTQEVIGMYDYPVDAFKPFDGSKYPYLFGRGELTEAEDYYDLYRDEDIAKQHFISMLQYMQDNEEFIAMMDSATGDFSEEIDFSYKIQYLKNHDLKVYGVAAIADKKALLNIMEDEWVYSIGTEKY
ncbi:MAG: anti sigma factor C-terminal domain-containing protein, partial [Firmicutes bacterium]|nr:anti sigma factor C-terminal domain-containing protein [Bacillota bacterium]